MKGCFLVKNSFSALNLILLLGFVCFSVPTSSAEESPPEAFDGKYYSGKGNTEFLRLLEFSRRLFSPDPEVQNISMLYSEKWNGFVEGPTWNAWWVQNSYGTSFAELPFLEEPYVTFLHNANSLWFEMMGDGKRKGTHDWVAPDGQLCDCASPDMVVYKQGDCRVDIHDWGLEFTAAGTLIMAESLLISRDRDEIARYLPYFRRSAALIESRRDPSNNLYLAGPAANLLAPSYAGYKIDGDTFGMAYLTGLSVTWIGALDRLIELEKLSGNEKYVQLYTEQRQLAREGLNRLMTEEGYFIKSLDPDGTRHGVYGAQRHGYFEAVCNHDAVALRITDDEEAKRIVDIIRSIPGLRPHDLIITNYPSLDDLYVKAGEPLGLFTFGHWVNGGHWTTCEARMILAYYRTGAYDDAARAMRKIESFAKSFRMDNPLVDFGNNVYQPKEPINCCYDTWGAPAAMIRGLFEYVYTAESLTLYPHIPVGITELVQKFPIRFGDRKIYLSVSGSGPIESVLINGNKWDEFEPGSVKLPYDSLPNKAQVHIVMAGGSGTIPQNGSELQYPLEQAVCGPIEGMAVSPETLDRFRRKMCEAGFSDSYEARHAGLILEYLTVIAERNRLLADGLLEPLPEPSQSAADISYKDAVRRLSAGFLQTVTAPLSKENPYQTLVRKIWSEVQSRP